MNRYNASSLTATQNLFTSALPVLLYIRTAGGVWLLSVVMVGILVMLSTLGGIFYCFRTTASAALIFCIAFFSVQNAFRISSFDCCINKGEICRMEGIVVYDSSFSEKGNSIIKLYVCGCESVYGIKSTAHGIVTAVSDSGICAMTLSRVRVTGFFSDNLFIADDFEVVDFLRANEMRASISGFFKRKLNPDDKQSRLCASLILGMAYEDGIPLRDKAKQCGCLHVLALSGMHLGIIVKLCRIFGKNRFAEALSVFLALMFVFIAGPRPSLIRALLSFFAVRILRNSDSGIIIDYVLITQAVLFPVTVADLGFVYCFCSISAVIVLSPVVRTFFMQILPDSVSSFLATQLSVVSVVAAVQIVFDGKWFPSVILSGMPASVIVEALMLCGIAIIVFGPVPFLKKICFFLYESLEYVFDKCITLFPPASWGFYCIVVLIIFATAFAAVVRKHIITEKSRRIIYNRYYFECVPK